MKTVATQIYKSGRAPQLVTVTGHFEDGQFVGKLFVRFAGKQVTDFVTVCEAQDCAVKTLIELRKLPRSEKVKRHIAELKAVATALYEIASAGNCYFAPASKPRIYITD